MKAAGEGGRMNVHHLELFYQVARHGGITRACRGMPYGVGQPAVSAQLLALERDLGVTLFRRKPFMLTEAGRELFAFAAPFFGGLADVEAHLRGRLAMRLRLAGPTEVVRAHVPELLRQMEVRRPGLAIKLVEADYRLAAELVERAEVDLAVVVPEEKAPTGLKVRLLVRLPLVLLVPSDWSSVRAARLMKEGAAGRHRLIGLPSHERLPRLFAEGLRKKGLVWPVSVEASSVDLVVRYVEARLGVGLAVVHPGGIWPTGVRAVELPGFAPLPIAAMWKGKLAEVPSEFLAGLEARASALQAEANQGLRAKSSAKDLAK